ncbi:MAG: hypothetical protein ACJ71R_05630 [Nitrososphaeraceae archaeon]
MLTKYDPIRLERAIIHLLEFDKWASKIWNYATSIGSEVSLKDFRKNVVIEVSGQCSA